MSKEIYKLYLEEPGSPTYTVYNKEVAEELLSKLFLKYGKQFSITLKKVEAPQ